MEPLERFGLRIRAVGCWSDNRLVGGALLRSYSVPLTRSTIIECLDGPIFLEWETAWAEALVVALMDLARQANSMALIIKDCPDAAVHRDLLAAFRERQLSLELRAGPLDAVLHLEGRRLEQIRSGCNRGTRQRIRKGQTANISIRRLTSPDDLAQAYAAWLATARRKSFTDVRPWAGLEPVLRHATEGGIGSVLGSFAGDRLLAAAFIVHVGRKAAYVYGGYIDGAEKLSSTHLLQFEAIKESLELGMTEYNFGNLLAEGQPAARGVDEFKLGFGAVPRRHLDTIVWKRKPTLFNAVEWLRQHRWGTKLEAALKHRMIKRGDLGR
jgi:hypothetical protein